MKNFYNITCLTLNKNPWHEPFDSTDRLNYFAFENHEQLGFNALNYTKKNKDYNDNLLVLRNLADIALFPLSPKLSVMRKYNITMTVPFMFSYNVIFSHLNTTAHVKPPEPFDEIFNVSDEVWICLVAVTLLLALVGIMDEQINGIRKKIFRNFADKMFRNYQVLMGQSIDLPSLPAIRISCGVWLLELLIFINIFSGIMKANYTAHPKKNINSIEDIVKTPGLDVDIPEPYQSEMCKTRIEEFVELCERSRKTKRKRYTNAQNWNLFVAGKSVTVGDFIVNIILMEYFLNNFTETQKYEVINRMHMSYENYLTKPIVYYISKDINKNALRLINRRLMAFYETNQFVLWHHRMERVLGMTFEPLPTTPTDTSTEPTRLKDMRNMFMLWISILGFAHILVLLEVMFYKFF